MTEKYFFAMLWYTHSKATHVCRASRDLSLVTPRRTTREQRRTVRKADHSLPTSQIVITHIHNLPLQFFAPQRHLTPPSSIASLAA